MLLHVRWEKTLFGLLYHTPQAGLFNAALHQWQPHREQPLVYDELFYAASPGQLGSFSYTYNPLSQLVRTHITLWTGHEERVEYALDGRRQLTSFRYRLQHGSQDISWTCIPPTLKPHLAAKRDHHVLLSHASPIK